MVKMKKNKLATYLIFTFLFLLASSLVSACSSFNSKAENYKLEGEQINKYIKYTADNKNFCVFSIGNNENNFFVIIDEQGNRVLDETLIIKSVIAFRTKDYIDQNYPSLENSFDQAYGKLRDLEPEEKDYYEALHKGLKALQGEYLDICLTPVPDFPWLKICLGETLKEFIIEKQCKKIVPKLLLACLDWSKTVDNFDRIRGNTLELKSDEHVYQDEIEKFYFLGKFITAFLEIVDRHSNQKLVSLFSYVNFEDLYKKNYEDSKSIPGIISSKIESIKTDLSNKRSITLQTSADLKNTIKGYQKEGYNMKSNYQEVCKIVNNIPSESLFEKEKFTDIRSQLIDLDGSLEELKKQIGSIPQEKHNFLKKKWNSIILFFWELVYC